MGQLDRDGGLGKALLECKSCLMLHSAGQYAQDTDICSLKLFFRAHCQDTTAERRSRPGLSCSHLSLFCWPVHSAVSVEMDFFLFWIARGKRKDWFMCATDHLLCVPPSLGVLISDLPPLSIITPATLFGQMVLCWSLSRSLFQGCGQLLVGLRRCLPLVDSKEKKGDLNLQTTSIGGNFLVLWSGTVVGCSLSSTPYILFTELSFCIMDLIWHM